MIAFSSTLVAAIGVALMSILIHNSDGHDGNDAHPTYEYTLSSLKEEGGNNPKYDVPGLFVYRQKILAVTDDWEKMYDSVFLRPCYERPYPANVMLLLMYMRRYLIQAEVTGWYLRNNEIRDVKYYYDELKYPENLSTQKVEELLRRVEDRPDYNPRNRKHLGSCDSRDSSMVDFLRALLKKKLAHI